MRTQVHETIAGIAPDAWNRLLRDGSPFLRHEFLHALEASGCAAADTGWYPCHLTLNDDSGELLGALPLYLKTNPYGEFVFDYAWANAYGRAGLSYYPKLVAAVPFTPASGPRILCADDHPQYDLPRLLLDAAQALAAANKASSLHILFADATTLEYARANGMLIRKDCQFHWQNKGYADFADFLAGFTASKRKKTLRERRRIRESGIEFSSADGHDLQVTDWDEIMPLYSDTFIRRGRMPYLNQDFFQRICATMPDNIVVFRGRDADSLVSVAICFRSETTLYGRYWGASRYVDSLHFETCYYQGIDYCIRHGLQRFEPGTQGEHKVSRGFVPTPTWSAHWLSHPQFSAAIDEYLAREREHIDAYIDVVGEHVPYKQQQD